MSRVVVIGDVVLDRDLDGRADRLCPDAPAPVVSGAETRSRPGGAGLAASLLAADGHAVHLVCALGEGAAAVEVRDLLERRGVTVVDLGGGGATPRKTRIRVDGHVLLRLDDDGERPRVAEPGAAVAAHLDAADAVLVSDYGRGVTGAPGLRRAVAATRAPVVWDPHPRGSDPVRGVRLVTPNAGEAAAMADGAPAGGDPGAAAATLRRRLGTEAVAVTLGSGGAVLADETGAVLRVPAPHRVAGDPCGAGDRFAATAATALAAGAGCAEAVAAGVAAATAMIAAGGPDAALGAAVAGDDDLERVRAAGGTIVATGGCFDLLHAGHVAMLEAARSLGDHLVVLLNSDASVRRLKGADRPLVDQSDRARVLGALRCVDAVVVFDEDTPAAALGRLRPDIWAKGADYAADELPEAAVVRAAGGEVVLLPYVAGRSTTRLIQEVALRATH